MSEFQTLVEPTRLLPGESPINAILAIDALELDEDAFLSLSYTRVRRDGKTSVDPQPCCPCNCADDPAEEDRFCSHSFDSPLWVPLPFFAQKGSTVLVCSTCGMHEGEHGF